MKRNAVVPGALLAWALLGAGCGSPLPPTPKPERPPRAAPVHAPAHASGGEAAAAEASPPAGEGPLVSIACEEELVWKVVQRIATLAEASVVCDPEHVQGRVTVNLVEVPWRYALESVAHSAGYVVADDGSGVLQVVTLERSYEIEEPVNRR